MNKINFVNNTTPALNATNLNKLQDNVEDGIDEVDANIGTLSNLQTTAKDNIVNAVNEVNTNANSKLSTSNIKTTKTTSTTDTYSCNYINELHSFEETEQLVGTWGGKPLYRNIISVTNITYGTATTINISSTYTIRRFEGYYERTNSRLDKFDNSANLSLAVRSGNLEYLINSVYQSGKVGMKVIIEYTKTTD